MAIPIFCFSSRNYENWCCFSFSYKQSQKSELYGSKSESFELSEIDIKCLQMYFAGVCMQYGSVQLSISDQIRCLQMSGMDSLALPVLLLDTVEV